MTWMESRVLVDDFRYPNLQDLYSAEYDDETRRWRDLGAVDKASHIHRILGERAKEVHSVLEVGCGTGSVLRRVAGLGIGQSHSGVEIGTSERTQNPTSDGLDIRGYDGKALPFKDSSVDLVYATHVVEHADDPRGFLRQMARVSRRYVVAEVPCESTARLHGAHAQRSLDIGHINFFSPESFLILLQGVGLNVLGALACDHSYAMHRYRSSAVAALMKVLIRRAALGLIPRMASRIFTYHYIVLCEPAARG